MDDPKRVPELFHPDLRNVPVSELVLRSSWFTRWYFPQEEQVNWYGDMLRASGAPGMYASPAQHAAWPSKVISEDIDIGPF